MLPNLLADDLDYVLEHTLSLWEEMRNKRIFITGGTGFFGCWLLESFIWANDKLHLNAEAVILTRNPQAFAKKCPHLANNKSLHFHIGDIKNFSYPTGNFSHIIHAATEVSVSYELADLTLLMDNIIQGTKHTLYFANECRAEKFLYISSGAIYGKQPTTISHLSEDHPPQLDLTDPRSAYAIGKYTAEFLCTLYAKKFNLDIKIARCFAFLGPYMPLDSHHAIGNFIKDAYSRKPINIKGDGKPIRSYLYAADLTIALWTILFKGESLRPYNVGSDQPVTITELAKLVAENTDRYPDINYLQSTIQGMAHHKYVPNVDRIKNELSVSQNIHLNQAIRATCRWYASNIEENSCK